MPYIHYESFNKIENTRAVIREVTHSKKTTENSKQVEVIVGGLDAITPTPSMLNSTSEMSLIKGYLYHKPPLHVRRSLDEFFYSSLIDEKIIQRDQNQIVFKFGKELNQYMPQNHKSHLDDTLTLTQYKKHDVHERTEKEEQGYRRGNRPIVMVDQLWMWVIGKGKLFHLNLAL
jgi:hypothetical protein